MTRRRNRTLLTASLAVLASASFGPFAYAQTQVAQASPQAPGGGLEEIVVTARKREEVLQTIPLSVTAFSGNTLEKMNISGLDQLGNAVPNLSITPGNSYVGGIEIAIRGIIEQDTILTNDSPIALYIDGVYIARDNGVPLDFVDLERVEVLRGPQGTLFGRNTTGGAVNIITKAPSTEFDISEKIDYASNNELTTRTVVDSGEIGEYGLKAKLSWQHHQMDGYVRNTRDSNPDDWPGADDKDSVNFALHGDITDALSFDYKFDYTAESTSLINYQLTTATPAGIAYFNQGQAVGGNAYQVSATRVGSLALYPVGPRSTLEALGHGLTLDYALNDALNFKLITAYRSMAMNAHESLVGQGLLYGPVLNPVTYAYAGIQRVTPYEVQCTGTSEDSCDNQHQYQFTEEFQASGTIDNFKYTAGLYYFTEHVGETDPQFYTYLVSFAPGAPPYGLNIHAEDNYHGRSTSYAGFAQTTYTPPVLDDRIQLTGGVRYTRDEKAVDIMTNPLDIRLLGRRFGDLSGDFTANFQWTPDIMLYARFANAYKSGGFNARDPGPGYQPEYANNYEGGIKSDWFEKHLRINADIFYTEYTNQQISTFSASTIPPSTITINAGQSTYLGGELEATIIPADGWLINTSFGYTSPQFQQFPYFNPATGQTTNIANIAKFTYFSKASLATGVQYTFEPMAFGDLSVRADFAYKSGEVYHPNPLQDPLTDILASKSLTDLGANVTLANIPLGFGSTGLKASVYGKNLLNQAWRTQGIDFSAFGIGGFGDNVYNRPRVIGFNLAYDFKPSGEASPAPAAYTPPPAVAPAPAPVAHSYMVFFDFNKSDLTSDAVAIVDQAAKNAGPAKATEITVTGHTDTVGSDAYNMRLSKRRAESVAAQLEKDGIPSSEIAIVAKGKHDLLVPTRDGVREPQNRRVTIVYDSGAGPNS